VIAIKVLYYAKFTQKKHCGAPCWHDKVQARHSNSK
jgi:hypothetical protein